METTQEQIAEYAEKIAPTLPGKIFGVRQAERFYFVRREGAGYEVWCGWVVPEGHDDDYGSYSIHPFKPERAQPWVGKSYKTDSAEDAARVYLEFKAGVLAGQMPKSGVTVGSVVRGR